ncbi:hypothetical protein DL766_009907 [Monosporascus sp. MC13-8B]|uniref:Uncharacterized protein n=1 Tax=Monosporascus cannonballus TaxID=155416 RepID=A0ABY0GXV1_9PEZI|nr:hypothetical protein DL763_009151 [Monosporascus cannonballus]RYO79989.1 hypothetical protein DL762_007880 [Monosporascus cannonballus]RYP12886.1 hypothetical protein DL766_009907 [Monosporascus sp. MC13-8B]
MPSSTRHAASIGAGPPSSLLPTIASSLLDRNRLFPCPFPAVNSDLKEVATWGYGYGYGPPAMMPSLYHDSHHANMGHVRGRMGSNGVAPSEQDTGDVAMTSAIR